MYYRLEGPCTQYLSFLVPKDHALNAFWDYSPSTWTLWSVIPDLGLMTYAESASSHIRFAGRHQKFSKPLGQRFNPAGRGAK